MTPPLSPLTRLHVPAPHVPLRGGPVRGGRVRRAHPLQHVPPVRHAEGHQASRDLPPVRRSEIRPHQLMLGNIHGHSEHLHEDGDDSGQWRSREEEVNIFSILQMD
ncbi:hypothetical protein ANANG_G00049390 [Anguilla anguilla]|uniref:Uncharacterized protein n=1 Tax=Anguilla anguilla TaxID=7936 RepID=A0A9D3MX81_ANGAN|nr:hypothetical protein ANANG_G00049390 [Anguilla anguilla]